ncbi:glutamate 5-kinase [Algiphilus sp.]|uniref:glutamate 5-kinase n=1 Tax=Algiphilus sp. TaxID=1872431 RepID=UPI003455848E|nr:glutamate 5-kinase [Algiphilus sp.]
MQGVRRLVVKVGSSLVTNQGKGLDGDAIAEWVGQITELLRAGVQVVLVSSGAVAEGRARLGMSQRPRTLHALQATAAVGQMGLVRAYENAFAQYGLNTAQVLLTHEDVAERSRYLNARSTLRTLLEWGVVPVVNENDTVSTDEIRLGDNDTLGALVCNLVEAEALIILTDQDGLYTRDPRQDDAAELIHDIGVSDPRLDDMAGDGMGALGRGGMRTKLTAARWAARSGASTIIAHGRRERVLVRLLEGEAELGTMLHADEMRIGARKRWIAGQLQSRGVLHLDEGAVRALRGGGASLLPVGVRSVEGQFSRGDVVRCVAPDGAEIARGLVNYSAAEATRICGVPTREINDRLGYVGESELIHRDDLALS